MSRVLFLEIFFMDGSGPFVWAVVFIFLTILFINVFLPLRRYKKLIQEHTKLLK